MADKRKKAIDSAIIATHDDDSTAFRTALECLLLFDGVITVAHETMHRTRGETTIFESTLSHAAVDCFDVLVSYQLVQLEKQSVSSYTKMLGSDDITNDVIQAFMERHLNVILNNTHRPDLIVISLMQKRAMSLSEVRSLFELSSGEVPYCSSILDALGSRVDGISSLGEYLEWLDILCINRDELFKNKDIFARLLRVMTNGGQFEFGELCNYVFERQCIDSLAFENQGECIGVLKRYLIDHKSFDIMFSGIRKESLLYFISGLEWVSRYEGVYGKSGATDLNRCLFMGWLEAQNIAEVDYYSWHMNNSSSSNLLKTICAEEMLLKSADHFNKNTLINQALKLSPNAFESIMQEPTVWVDIDRHSHLFDFDLERTGDVSEAYIMSLYYAFRQAGKMAEVDYKRVDILLRYIDKVNVSKLSWVAKKDIVDVKDINQWRIRVDISSVDKPLMLLFMVSQFGLADVMHKLKTPEVLDIMLSLFSPFDILEKVPGYKGQWKQDILRRMS